MVGILWVDTLRVTTQAGANRSCTQTYISPIVGINKCIIREYTFFELLQIGSIADSQETVDGSIHNLSQTVHIKGRVQRS